MGRDDHHFQPVDVLEFVGFGIGGAGHAGELAVHAEIVLEGDRGQRLVLALDRHAFLGFDGLMQAIGPAAALQGTAGELVDDDDFAVAHDVIDVTLVQGMRAQGGIQMVDHRQIVAGIQTVVLGDDAGFAQQLFRALHAGFRKMGLLGFLIDPEIAFAVFLFLLDEFRHDAVDFDVQLG